MECYIPYESEALVMDVQLKPEVEQFIHEQVRAGHFSSPAEVLEAGVARLMLDPDPNELDDETQAAIEEAEAQLDRGEGMPLDEAFEKLRHKHLGK